MGNLSAGNAFDTSAAHAPDTHAVVCWQSAPSRIYDSWWYKLVYGHILRLVRGCAAAMYLVSCSDQLAHVHMKPVHWKASRQEVAVLISENVAYIAGYGSIVAKQSHLVSNLPPFTELLSLQHACKSQREYWP